MLSLLVKIPWVGPVLDLSSEKVAVRSQHRSTSVVGCGHLQSTRVGVQEQQTKGDYLISMDKVFFFFKLPGS